MITFTYQLLPTLTSFLFFVMLASFDKEWKHQHLWISWTFLKFLYYFLTYSYFVETLFLWFVLVYICPVFSECALFCRLFLLYMVGMPYSVHGSIRLGLLVSLISMNFFIEFHCSCFSQVHQLCVSFLIVVRFCL